MKFTKPILVIGFNRPELVSELINHLRNIEPSVIYFAVDGPRKNVITDEKQVENTKAVVNEIDWPCRISTKFSSENLGCQQSVITAIEWVFRTEKEV